MSIQLWKRQAVIFPLVAASFGIASCQPQATETPTGAVSPAAALAGGENVSLVGAGASFPAPLYQRWTAAYNQENPNVRISYQSIGSGAGIEQFTQGTVDFAASDVAITKEQAAKVERGAIALPLTAGSVVLAYKLPNEATSLTQLLPTPGC